MATEYSLFASIKGAIVIYQKQKGFTLIEVMIVVGIIAILAAIALPNYSAYVKRAARVSAENYLSDLAQREELRFQNTRTYSATAGNFPGMPGDVSQRYQAPVLSITPVSGLPAFQITLMPIVGGAQDGDGWLYIDSVGGRYRDVNANGVLDAGDKRWDEN